ncbi:hypothetical protein ABDK00_013335 [Niabella insulamsoli]|uniref:hypothetical protein n=1 Tax=Niabella insulamsoli TaxID=3144874 RepID=UPI0031FDDBFF
MKTRISIFAFLLIFLSCASARTQTTAAAQKKVDELRPLLHLSPEQAKQLVAIESVYLADVEKLQQSGKNNEEQVAALRSRKLKSAQKILSRAQYIKFQSIEHQLIKKVPVRAD